MEGYCDTPAGTAPGEGPRAVVYVRHDGDSAVITNADELTAWELSERLGWELIEVYVDLRAAELIAEQEQRDHDLALSRWEGEGGR